MKLVYAIISSDNEEEVREALHKEGYKATKLSTTGSFLKQGNTTLMICTEDEKMKQVARIVEKVCGKRRKIELDVPYTNPECTMAPAGGYYIPAWYTGAKKEIEVGGAIIFAVDVCYYEKI